LDAAMPAIRNAKPSDARSLAELAERTFRDAFGAMNTAENLELHCRTSYGEAIQSAELSDPGIVTLVVEEKGTLVAFAQLRWDRTEDCVAARRPGEIRRLYVREDRHGTGIARELMAACLARMRERGSDVAWLGVWEKNPRAIAFYKKHGFAEVGSHVFPVGTDPQRDIVMARPVA